MYIPVVFLDIDRNALPQHACMAAAPERSSPVLCTKRNGEFKRDGVPQANGRSNYFK